MSTNDEDVSYDYDYDDVTVLVPTLNEEATVGKVVSEFASLGCDNILVIDGKSTDNTQQVARDAGAKVIVQESNGKGAAVREALEFIETEYTVMVDGDDTYEPDHLPRIMTELYRGSDEVLANRFGDMKPGAMSQLHQFGNKIANTSFFFLTGTYVKDLLTGYRGYKTDVLRQIEIDEERFGVETEITMKIALSEYTSTVVPTSYKPRPTDSEANLNSFGDGFDIFTTMVSLRFQGLF